MNYPFNTGDLLCCGQCAANYLDANAKVPWEDLRFASYFLVTPMPATSSASIRDSTKYSQGEIAPEAAFEVACKDYCLPGSPVSGLIADCVPAVFA